MTKAVETIRQHGRELAAAEERVRLLGDDIKHHKRMMKVLSENLTSAEKSELNSVTEPAEVTAVVAPAEEKKPAKK